MIVTFLLAVVLVAWSWRLAEAPSAPPGLRFVGWTLVGAWSVTFAVSIVALGIAVQTPAAELATDPRIVWLRLRTWTMQGTFLVEGAAALVLIAATVATMVRRGPAAAAAPSPVEAEDEAHPERT